MNGVDRLQNILSNSTVGTVLPAISQLNLPDWWLAGGGFTKYSFGVRFLAKTANCLSMTSILLFSTKQETEIKN